MAVLDFSSGLYANIWVGETERTTVTTELSTYMSTTYVKTWFVFCKMVFYAEK